MSSGYSIVGQYYSGDRFFLRHMLFNFYYYCMYKLGNQTYKKHIYPRRVRFDRDFFFICLYKINKSLRDVGSGGGGGMLWYSKSPLTYIIVGWATGNQHSYQTVSQLYEV